MQGCPMFHRVSVQTQIKPGTGFWGFVLWKEKRLEVFSTSLWPNHVIPGRGFSKFGSGHMADGKNVRSCDSETTPNPRYFTPPRLLKRLYIMQAKCWETQLGNTLDGGDHSETWGQKCIQMFPGHEMICSLIKLGLRACQHKECSVQRVVLCCPH